MKKLMTIATTFVVMATLLIGCGSGDDKKSAASGGSGGSDAKTLTFSMAHPFPESDYRAKGYAYFAENVEKRTNGSVKIKIHPAQSLIKVQESFDAINSGTVDMATVYSSFASNKLPDFAIMDVSGGYIPEKWKELEKEIHPIIQNILSPQGMQYLFPDYEVSTVVTLKPGAGPIKTLDDWKGYKLRDYGVYVGKQLSLWGATPVNIPLSDLNAAVQNKTVDGVYIGWPNVRSFKLYEMTPNITFTGLSTFWGMMVMNQESYNKLNDDQKKVFAEVGEETMLKFEEFAKVDYDQLMQEIQKAKATVYTFSDADRKAHREAIQPLIDEIGQKSGENGKKLIEALKKYQ